MVVDSHVHGRDFLESRKETLYHALAVAKGAGVSGVFFMPNTDPPLTTRERVLDYLKLADESKSGVFAGVHMGLTSDLEQVKNAVKTYRELFPRVVGFKLYAGHSTNNLGVIGEEDQRKVFGTLSKEGYEGVLFVHAEKESYMNSKLFDPKNPITHAELARPPQAEAASIRDMLTFSREAGFLGKLHIAHISTPLGVGLVVLAKSKGFDVSCGVTPHHLFYDSRRMYGPDGLLFKMNPPLRSAGTPETMLDCLREGYIDWIETDHAPHLLGEKMSESCPSGVSALHAWQLFLHKLKLEGFSEDLIDNRTHHAIVDRFGIEIPLKRGGRYDSDAYEVNVWKPLEEMVANS